ncbi:MAG: hypothetical protein DME48_09445 [Verrucomicrobia bacterium]|nr:MAG: hypothetical protein DME48_09445 [Verrucomicrobiota bacterium]
MVWVNQPHLYSKHRTHISRLSIYTIFGFARTAFLKTWFCARISQQNVRRSCSFPQWLAGAEIACVTKKFCFTKARITIKF